MKFGSSAKNFTKKNESKSANKTSSNNPNANFIAISNDNLKKRKTESVKKPTRACTNLLASSVSTTGSLANTLGINTHVHSTKETENKKFLLLYDDKSYNNNLIQNNFTSPGNKLTPKNSQTKTTQVNLWRKNLNQQPSPNFNTNNINTKTKKNNLNINVVNKDALAKKSSNGFKNININTGNTANDNPENIQGEIIEKTVTPVQKYLEAPKNKDNVKILKTKYDKKYLLNKDKENNTSSKQLMNHNIIHKNLKNIITSSPTKNFNTKEFMNTKEKRKINSETLQSEILSKLTNFKSLLNTDNIDKLFKCEENLNTLNGLNHKLNSCNNQSNLLNDLNVIKRETFVDNNFNKKTQTTEIKYNNININVINANMLMDNNPTTKKENVMTEIYLNSDMRMKKYEILIDFINSNLQEINQLIKDKDNKEDLQSHKMSSLHSRINLDHEESQIHKRKYEVSPSFLISSINSEFYQNLLEESNLNNNVSNDISSIRTHKLERVLSLESDKTPMQYRNKLSHIASDLQLCNELIGTHDFLKQTKIENLEDYNDGDENLEESDLDKTKENLQVFDMNKNYGKDLERIRFFSHKIPPKILSSKSLSKVVEERSYSEHVLDTHEKDKSILGEKQGTSTNISKTPENKGSKCLVF